MTAASLAAFRRTVTVDWPKATEAQVRAHLLRVAGEGHAQTLREQAARSGLVPDFEAYANRPGNANLQSVALPGPIVFRYDYRREIVKVALEALRSASPVQSGAYRDAHALFLDGAPIARLPIRLPRGAEIMIANPVPYARRLEVGKTKEGRKFVLQVDDHIYERVAKRVLFARYKNVADIRFVYVSLPGSYQVKGRLGGFYLTGELRKKGSKLGAKGTPKRRLRQPKAGALRAPAILIASY